MSSGRGSVVVRDLVVGEGLSDIVLLRCPELAIDIGTLVGIQGPSGSGKSTLLRVITGRQVPLGGSVEVFGSLFTGVRSHVKDSMRARFFTQVIQEAGLVEGLTVNENILAGCFVSGARPGGREISEVLSMLGVLEVRDSLPNEISGGQAQRVQIARALLSAAPFMVMDEPTSGLDSCMRDVVSSAIRKEVQGRARAAVLVSHDSEVLASCDAIYAIASNHVVEQVK